MFGDGPGRYIDPKTKAPYCSLACAKRLREQQESVTVTLSLIENQPLPPSSVQSQEKALISSRISNSSKTVSSPAQKKAAPVAPVAPVAQPAMQPTIVSTTTPQGQVMQFQLNYPKTVYVNSKAVSVQVNPNQVYYLQTEVDGNNVVNAHLMTGSTQMADGNVYYCMVPMIPLQNPSN